MKLGVIYVIIHNDTGKLYVGRSVDFARRLGRHKSAKSNSLLHSAIKKYGWHRFNTEIIESDIPEKDLNIREQFWIKYLYSVEFGYNLTYGGDGAPSGILHPHKSELARARLSKIHANPIVKQKEIKAKEHKMIKILCHQNNKNYNSLNEASRDLNLKVGHISEMIKKVRKTVKGYTFERII